MSVAQSLLHLQTAAQQPLFTMLSRRKMRLGEILVRGGYLDKSLLRKALARRARSTALIGEILTRNGLVADDIIPGALALQWQLGLIDLEKSPPDPELLHGIDPAACLRHGAVPWRRVGGVTIVAMANPSEAEAVLPTLGLPRRRIAIAIASETQIRACVERSFAPLLEARASTLCPAPMSCRNWTGRNVTRVAAFVLGLFALFALVLPIVTAWVAIAWIVMFNLVTTAIRFAGLFGPRRQAPASSAAINDTDIPKIGDFRALPKISLMVPLHREDLVLTALTGHIRALDYPPELVDLKLLVEDGDDITLDAIKAGGFDQVADVIVVPPGPVTTKPRALNYGLNFCEGSLIGILDAEDRPEPDQLRKVVDHLHYAPPDVAAVQGELDFYNTKRNWMSRCFTIEYSVWFKVLLRGLRHLDLPIPLGGTTVYFRRAALEALGGWDAHNVTEDADLGFRIARAGLKTEMLPSTTWEEANSVPVPWIKQRSRWLKGYMITWAVHMRNPRALYRDLGLWGFASFQVTLLGGVTSYLSMPILWIMWFGALDFGLNDLLNAPGYVWAYIFTTLSLGNLVMATVMFLAIQRSKRHYLLWTAPTMLIYWTLGAFATMKALAETLYAPFYWDKTTHGTQSDQEFDEELLKPQQAFG